MTDLQIGLIGAGIAIIIAVIAYNAWQRHRAKKHVEKAFPNPVGDALMEKGQKKAGYERKEPVLSGDGTGTDAAGSAGTADGAPAEGSAAGGSIIDRVQKLPVDDLIELPICLVPEGLLHAEKILPQLQTLHSIGGKAVRFLGIQEEEEEPAQKNNWKTVEAGGIYRQLKACVLLANRSGPLNEIEFSELLGRLHQIGEAIGAEPEVPEMSGVVEKARQLYQFVMKHDAKLGISIRSNDKPWQITFLKTVLEDQGLAVHADSQFIMNDKENGGTLFSLTTNESAAAETASRLTLLLDVPCVAQESDGFGQMIACAKALCIRLDGALIDDNNQILADTALDSIRKQVDEFYQEMAGSSIPAGSIRALRLFT